MSETTVERTTLRLPAPLHEAIRTEAFNTKRSMQTIITEQLMKRYERDPLFFGSRSDLRDHTIPDVSDPKANARADR